MYELCKSEARPRKRWPVAIAAGLLGAAVLCQPNSARALPPHGGGLPGGGFNAGGFDGFRAISQGSGGGFVVVGGSYPGWGHGGWAGGHGGSWAGHTLPSEEYAPPPRGMPACRATLSVTGGYVNLTSPIRPCVPRFSQSK